MADWKLSKAAVLRDTTMTKTMPTVHAGSCSSKRKKAILPSWSGLAGSKAPDHVAIRPLTPTSVRMTKTATAAIEIPIHKSLSVFDAKARIQKLERKKSFVKMATGSM